LVTPLSRLLTPSKLAITSLVDADLAWSPTCGNAAFNMVRWKEEIDRVGRAPC
jgi:hypothetical protein